MLDLEYFAKAKDEKTFKQHQQECLLKAIVILASELFKRMHKEEERAKDFIRAEADEEFVNRNELLVSWDRPRLSGQRLGVVTREPFKDLP